MIGLWRELNLSDDIKGKRVIARACRRRAVDAVKTARRAPRAIFNTRHSRSPPMQTGQVASPLLRHPRVYPHDFADVGRVTEDAGAGPSVNCTAEDAATLGRQVAVGMDCVALSANPCSLESAVEACSHTEGD